MLITQDFTPNAPLIAALQLGRVIRLSALVFLVFFFGSLFVMPSDLSLANASTEYDSSAALGSARPRLYFTEEKLDDLKLKLNTDLYRIFWAKVKAQADSYINADINFSGDVRPIGNKLSTLAFAYLMTKQDAYLAESRRLANAISAQWTPDKDLGDAHLLIGLSTAYDWLNSVLTADEKTRYSTLIKSHANTLYQALVNKSMWWARTEYLLQNHNYTIVLAIAIAGEALRGEDAVAANWTAAAKANFDEVLTLLSPDGASHEGIGYWGYGTQSLLMYYLFRPTSNDKSAIENNGFFQNAAKFRLYSSLPGYSWNVDFADSPRYEWYGPGSMLRALASLYKDGHAQWLANKVEAARAGDAIYSWLDLLWYDPSITPKAPDDMPLYAYFSNLGIFIGRSSWSDSATWIFFKAGPSQGFLADEKEIYTGSHIHPDEGNFLVWSNGKWLVVEDGYVYKKMTANHNVLLFNDKGQLGEGGMWFDALSISEYKATVRILHKEFNAGYQYLVADIGAMYPPDAGIDSWKRTFVFLPPNILVINDDIDWKTSGIVREVIHFNETPVEHSQYTACLNAVSQRGVVDVFPQDVSRSIGTYNIPSSEGTHYTNSEGGAVRLSGINVEQLGLVIDANRDCGEGEVSSQRFATLVGDTLEIQDEENMIRIDLDKRKVSVLPAETTNLPIVPPEIREQ